MIELSPDWSVYPIQGDCTNRSFLEVSSVLDRLYFRVTFEEKLIIKRETIHIGNYSKKRVCL